MGHDIGKFSEGYVRKFSEAFDIVKLSGGSNIKILEGMI